MIRTKNVPTTDSLFTPTIAGSRRRRAGHLKGFALVDRVTARPMELLVESLL